MVLVCSIFLYLEWAGGQSAFPFSEGVVYVYVSHLGQEGAPATRASLFLEAVRFTSSLLGIPMKDSATTSARVTGAVLASYDRKRVTRQAPPLETGLVRGLEIAVATAREPAVRSVAGFALFVLLPAPGCQMQPGRTANPNSILMIGVTGTWRSRPRASV